MDEIKIKDAFQKVKEDIDFLKKDINFLKNTLFYIKSQLNHISTDTLKNPTNPTNPSTHNINFKPLNGQNLSISTGNQGASTDRQTDRQTDTFIKKSEKNNKNNENSLNNALKTLDSLDSIKREIRLKFKRLTKQEFLVFSTIYQLNEEIDHVDYRALSERLGLTESSIRDYVGRIIKKGIPLNKEKINNKNISLSISQNLRRVVSLPTILQLRDV